MSRSQFLHSDDPDEMYANAFAFALLTPEAAVRKLHAQDHTVVTMAYTFGIPADIMAMRLNQLGLSLDPGN